MSTQDGANDKVTQASRQLANFLGIREMNAIYAVRNINSCEILSGWFTSRAKAEDAANYCEQDDTQPEVQVIERSTDGYFLYDSSTLEEIRVATPAEVVESFQAGPEGHIDVGGRTVFAAD
jgi:hypothetical protein